VTYKYTLFTFAAKSASALFSHDTPTYSPHISLALRTCSAKCAHSLLSTERLSNYFLRQESNTCGINKDGGFRYKENWSS